MAGATSGIGGADAAIESAKMQMAEQIGRQADLMKRKNDRAERKAMTTADAMSMIEAEANPMGPLTEQQFLKKELSGGGRTIGFLESDRRGAIRAADAASSDAEREASNQAAQAKKDELESSKALKQGFGYLTVAAAILGGTLTTIANAQKEGALTIDAIRKTRGRALQGLGVSGADADAWGRESESTAGPGGGMTASEDAQLLDAASGAFLTPSLGNQMLPQIRAIIKDKRLSFAQKREMLQSGTGMIAKAALAGIGRGDTSNRTQAAVVAGAQRDQALIDSQAKSRDDGSRVAFEDAMIQRAVTSGNMTMATLENISGVPLVGSLAKVLQRDEVEMRGRQQMLQIRHGSEAFTDEQRLYYKEHMRVIRDRAPASTAGRQGGN